MIKGFKKTDLRNCILSSHNILTGTCCCFMLISCLGFTHPHAGPYGGFISAGEFIDAHYNKTVDNTHPQNVSTQKGIVNRAESNTDGVINGLGYQIGYRIPFGKDVFFLSGEFDYLHHGGSVYGSIEEEGTSEAPNQLGESWSEQWTFQRINSYGMALKLGTSPGTLRSWKAGVYVLAGVRLAKSRLDAYYNGCFKPEPCGIGGYESGRAAKDFYSTAWTSGVGVEKKIGKHRWIEVEWRYTSFTKEKWITPFPDLGVEVTSDLVSQAADLRINVVLR